MEVSNSLLLKIIELGIAIICIVLWENVSKIRGIAAPEMIVCGTMAGYAVICGVLFIGHIINSIVGKPLNAIFSLVGCILFFTSGFLIIKDWYDVKWFQESRRFALATGSLMIINAAVFLLDIVFISRTVFESHHSTLSRRIVVHTATVPPSLPHLQHV